MRTLAWCVLLLAGAAGCAADGAALPSDSIPGMPPPQQRTVTRGELRYKWPFTVGTGTLGCQSGAVVFRSAGRTYAVNEAAAARGFAPIDPIRQTQSSGPPINPLGRLPQHRRMDIFAALSACRSDGACRRGVRETQGLSDADVTQIEAEGLERRWPPLSRARIPLEPIVSGGLELCAR
jgi:hypothetical protein